MDTFFIPRHFKGYNITGLSDSINFEYTRPGISLGEEIARQRILQNERLREQQEQIQREISSISVEDEKYELLSRKLTLLVKKIDFVEKTLLQHKGFVRSS